MERATAVAMCYVASRKREPPFPPRIPEVKNGTGITQETNTKSTPPVFPGSSGRWNLAALEYLGVWSVK